LAFWTGVYAGRSSQSSKEADLAAIEGIRQPVDIGKIIDTQKDLGEWVGIASKPGIKESTARLQQGPAEVKMMQIKGDQTYQNTIGPRFIGQSRYNSYEVQSTPARGGEGRSEKGRRTAPMSHLGVSSNVGREMGRP